MIRCFILIILAIFLNGFLPNFIVKEETEKIKEPPEFKYSNNQEFITSLKNCISHLNAYIPKQDQINTELIVAQAIVESNHGTSRFAREGHNLFGIRTWSKEGMLPLKQPKTIAWRVKVFKSKCESVDYYIKTLNTHKAYTEFRKVRETTLNKDPIQMAQTLYNFSTNKYYEKYVIRVINKLRNDENKHRTSTWSMSNL